MGTATKQASFYGPKSWLEFGPGGMLNNACFMLMMLPATGGAALMGDDANRHPSMDRIPGWSSVQGEC